METKTAQQLSMFRALSNDTPKFEPIAHGDIVVTKKHVRHVVIKVDDNIDGFVFMTVRLDNGNDAIVLEREVAYRAR